MIVGAAAMAFANKTGVIAEPDAYGVWKVAAPPAPLFCPTAVPAGNDFWK
jgi:hypothetical protein